MHLSRAFLILLSCVFVSAVHAEAQPSQNVTPAPTPGAPAIAADSYVPATSADRIEWTVVGVVGRRSLAIVGPLAAGWQTGFNTPSEWQRSWSGFGKRYLERGADVAISNTIEAGLGAFWGEEPRYIMSRRRGIGPRARYAVKMAFLAQRPDGHVAPAWGRYAGNVFNNVIENSWLPPSSTTPGQTVLRSGLGLASRIGSNAWEEFWPDAWRLLRKRMNRP